MLLDCRCGQTNRVPSRRLLDRPTCGACRQALAPPAAPLPVADGHAFRELIEGSPLPVLVDFWAPWCGPCRTVAPELAQLAARHAGALIVAKVNSDEVPDVSAAFGIRSIPTLVLFEGGRERHRESGAMPAARIERAFGL